MMMMFDSRIIGGDTKKNKRISIKSSSNEDPKRQEAWEISVPVSELPNVPWSK